MLFIYTSICWRLCVQFFLSHWVCLFGCFIDRGRCALVFIGLDGWIQLSSRIFSTLAKFSINDNHIKGILVDLFVNIGLIVFTFVLFVFAKIDIHRFLQSQPNKPHISFIKQIKDIYIHFDCVQINSSSSRSILSIKIKLNVDFTPTAIKCALEAIMWWLKCECDFSG